MSRPAESTEQESSSNGHSSTVSSPGLLECQTATSCGARNTDELSVDSESRIDAVIEDTNIHDEDEAPTSVILYNRILTYNLA